MKRLSALTLLLSFLISNAQSGIPEFAPQKSDLRDITYTVISSRNPFEHSVMKVSNSELSDTDDKYLTDWNFSQPDIIIGEKVTFITPMILLGDFQGYFMLAIVDESGTPIEFASDIRCAAEWYPYYRPCEGVVLRFENVVFNKALSPGQHYQLICHPHLFLSDMYDCISYDPSDDPGDWIKVPCVNDARSYFDMTGNRSEVSDVRFHIDGDFPYQFNYINSDDAEFVLPILRGDVCEDVMICPVDGLDCNIQAYDTDGASIPEDTMESVLRFERDKGSVSLAFPVYHNRYDVNISYRRPADTRRDSDIDPDYLLEEEGLIYRIDYERASSIPSPVGPFVASLIGYDNVGETVNIPTYVKYNGLAVPVRYIEPCALLYAPVRNLIISAKQLFGVSSLCFAGMPDLESIRTITLGNGWSEQIFNSSHASRLYLDGPINIDIINAAIGYKKAHALNNPQDVDVYVSAWANRPDNDYYWNSDLYMLLANLKNTTEGKLMNNIYIPGIGSQTIMNRINNYGLPVTEMWNYALDKDCNVVSISNVRDFVSIDRVLINGCVAKVADDGLYYFAPKPDGSVEVYINYTLNGEQSMGTHYSTDYNARLESTAITNSVHYIEQAAGDASVDVYSLQGILLLHNVTAGDVRNLPSGVYIINGKKISL